MEFELMDEPEKIETVTALLVVERKRKPRWRFWVSLALLGLLLATQIVGLIIKHRFEVARLAYAETRLQWLEQRRCYNIGRLYGRFESEMVLSNDLVALSKSVTQFFEVATNAITTNRPPIIFRFRLAPADPEPPKPVEHHDLEL